MTASTMNGVVIVGASLAGMTAASELASRGYPGPVTVIGDEPHEAYARPPLSKGVLKGTEADESIVLPQCPSEHITVRVGTAVSGLDPNARRVQLAGGGHVDYDRLIIACGGTPRRLGDGTDQYVVRTIEDARRLRAALATAGDIVVVGGGFLGMEVASAAVELGCGVRVVSLETPMVSVLGAALGALVLEAAAERGVQIDVCPDGVALARDEGGAACGVVTPDGRVIPGDVIVTAIGDEPNTEWLQGSGVELDGQGWIVVDEYTRVAGVGFEAGEILAAGDVTTSPTQTGRRRMPHWENAIGQAKAAVATIMDGATSAYEPDPYFWTEAFGIAYKIAGPIPVQGEPVPLKGSLAERAALLHWPHPVAGTVAAVNHRIPVARLKRQARELQSTKISHRNEA